MSTLDSTLFRRISHGGYFLIRLLILKSVCCVLSSLVSTDVVTVVGSRVNFSCISGKQLIVRWNYHHPLMTQLPVVLYSGLSFNPTASPRFSVNNRSDGSQLVIDNVQLTDAGRYECLKNQPKFSFELTVLGSHPVWFSTSVQTGMPTVGCRIQYNGTIQLVMKCLPDTPGQPVVTDVTTNNLTFTKVIGTPKLSDNITYICQLSVDRGNITLYNNWTTVLLTNASDLQLGVASSGTLQLSMLSESNGETCPESPRPAALAALSVVVGLETVLVITLILVIIYVTRATLLANCSSIRATCVKPGSTATTRQNTPEPHIDIPLNPLYLDVVASTSNSLSITGSVRSRCESRHTVNSQTSPTYADLMSSNLSRSRRHSTSRRSNNTLLYASIDHSALQQQQQH